jgi:kynurenine formamidase
MTAGAPFGFSRVVFLSHVLAPCTPVFPGDPPVTIEAAATVASHGYYLQRVAYGEQAGTHWAAPAHFHPGELAADALAPADFFCPAAVVDARAEAARDPDFALGVDALRRFEDAFGRIPERAAVLLWTGYDARWHEQAAYLGTDESGGMHYPGFSEAAARWLIGHRGIGALGTDTMGVDPGADTAFRANRLLLRGHRIHLENLCGLGQLPALGGWIVVGGVRVSGGSGSPATVFGLTP